MWLVTWIVLNTFLVACPSPPIICDEFGRCPHSVVTTLQACWDTTKEVHSQRFESSDEAVAFVKRGLEQKDLTDFEIKMATKG